MTGRFRSDRGNIIVAVMIIMIVSSIATALTYQVIGNGLIVVSRQKTASALAAADAGLADALFRLNQNPEEQGNGREFCVDTSPDAGSSGSCLSTSLPGLGPDAAVRYQAQYVSATKWTIDSVGRVGNQTAAVHEEVARAPEYQFALFANSSLTFNGNAQGSFSTYTDQATESATNPDPNGDLAIGSNGPITCNGGVGSNVTTDYFGTASVSSLSNTCGSPVAVPTTNYLPPVSTAGLSTDCPGGSGGAGTLGSGYGYATLAAGTYVCRSPVTIKGLLTVGGPVVFYIDLSNNSSYSAATSALTIDSSSYVNDLYDYCVATPGDTVNCPGGASAQLLPDAPNLQILVNSNGQVGFDNGQGYYFGGVLYAPRAYLTEDGCKSHYYGSLTINTLTCNGGPHLYVSYDNSVAAIYGAWTVGSYTQENPGLLWSSIP